MARPPKWRRVGYIPDVTFFKPAGIPMAHLEEIQLSVEEAEAIRLKDLEGLEQEECARRMHISRPTFHRVLGSARRKLADALLNGKAVRIEGGKFEMDSRRFRCRTDGHEWNIPFEKMIMGPPSSCPRCESPNIGPSAGFNNVMRGRGRGRRGRHRQGQS